MYLAIITLPLLGSIVSGFFGRKVGVSGAQLITCSCVISTTLLAIVAFFEVGLNNIPVSIQLFRWIDSESLNVSWGFHFDSLTVSMLIPVLIVSSLVHLYSVGYMSHDPHNQRFFSYLSLFTFMMIILVTANNFLLMFVGWEGRNTCLKWYNGSKGKKRIVRSLSSNYKYFNQIMKTNFPGLNISSSAFKKFNYQCKTNKTFFQLYSKHAIFKRDFHVKTNNISRLKSDLRIGPHNLDVISVLVGSILGDSHLEKRKMGLGTRVIFEQCNRNVEYIMWFHEFFSTRGYCSTDKPKLITRIKKHNKVFYQYRVSSYTFTSLNWLHEMFYTEINSHTVKIIPQNLTEYLTPLALAIWFMDDGSKINKTVRIATNCFQSSDLKFLCKLLKDKYDLNASIQKSGKDKGNILYIKTNSLTKFINLVKPHMLPSMYYKLEL